MLMGKIILLARITHYGFCLAMPASLLFIVAVWDWVPWTIERGAVRVTCCAVHFWPHCWSSSRTACV